jgi:hypothetical protein
MKKDFGLLAFVIPLAFACLREAPPAKVLVRRAGASAKAGERVGVRGAYHTRLPPTDHVKFIFQSFYKACQEDSRLIFL